MRYTWNKMLIEQGKKPVQGSNETVYLNRITRIKKVHQRFFKKEPLLRDVLK